MGEEPDYYRLSTGKTLEELTRLPSIEETLAKKDKELKTKFPKNLLLLGTSQEKGEQFITQEERSANFHLIGAPGKGKSKFLEYHIRKDIDAGNGLCLLDPSEKGNTARNVLEYCASINYKKV